METDIHGSIADWLKENYKPEDPKENPIPVPTLPKSESERELKALKKQLALTFHQEKTRLNVDRLITDLSTLESVMSVDATTEPGQPNIIEVVTDTGKELRAQQNYRFYTLNGDKKPAFRFATVKLSVGTSTTDFSVIVGTETFEGQEFMAMDKETSGMKILKAYSTPPEPIRATGRKTTPVGFRSIGGYDNEYREPSTS
jgi:hypothetical protein